MTYDCTMFLYRNIDHSGWIYRINLKNSIFLLNLMSKNVGKNSIKVACLLIVFGIRILYFMGYLNYVTYYLVNIEIENILFSEKVKTES